MHKGSAPRQSLSVHAPPRRPMCQQRDFIIRHIRYNKNSDVLKPSEFCFIQPCQTLSSECDVTSYFYNLNTGSVSLSPCSIVYLKSLLRNSEQITTSFAIMGYKDRIETKSSTQPIHEKKQPTNTPHHF